jgi:hypothetical protein
MPLVIHSLDLTVDGTTNGTPKVPFTRLPTICGLATTVVSVQTHDATSPNGGGSSSFTPSSCNTTTPAYTPTLTASVVKDSHDPGVRFVTTVSQPPSMPPDHIQAGTEQSALGIPLNVVGTNVGPAGKCLILEGGCIIGSAVVKTPLLSAPLTGALWLEPPISAPSLKIIFPPPVPFSFSGAVDLKTGLTTFSSLPDTPLNSLEVIVDGGPNSAFASTCFPSSGVVTGSFIGQNGAKATSNAPFIVRGCPTPKASPPTVSGGSLTGLAKGHAKLRFSLTAGTSAPLLTSFTLSAPPGLHFVAKQLNRSIKLSGAQLGGAGISHGALVVTFAHPVGRVSVTVGGQAITVSSRLTMKAKRHKLTKLRDSVSVTDAAGKTTMLKLHVGKLS